MIIDFMIKKNLFKKRINTLIHISIDFILYFILNFIVNGILNLEILNFYFIGSWIFVSYIFDRYHLRSFKFKQVRKYILKTFLIYFLFFFINFIFDLDKFFISTFFSFSIFAQFFYLKMSLKKRKCYKRWLTNDINLMHTVKSQPKQFREHKLFFFKKISKYNLMEFEGIIIDNNLPKDKFLKDINKAGKFKIFSTIDWCEIYLESFPLNIIRNDIFFLNLKNQNPKKFYSIFKRFFEIIFSNIILIILSPIILIFSLLVLSQDGFPIFYSQDRKGKNNKIYKIFKIRSMKKDSELNGPQWTSFNDSRITFIGKFIRKNRIDELPQLLSVIIGELSLIGPRPERPEIDKILEKEIDFYNYRYLVKPGITGWAQVNYPYGASIEDSKIKQSYDLYYVKNISLILDLIIFFKTIRLILNGRGAIPLEKNNSIIQ